MHFQWLLDSPLVSNPIGNFQEVELAGKFLHYALSEVARLRGQHLLIWDLVHYRDGQIERFLQVTEHPRCGGCTTGLLQWLISM